MGFKTSNLSFKPHSYCLPGIGNRISVRFVLALCFLIIPHDVLAAAGGAASIGTDWNDPAWKGFGGMMCKFQGQSASLPNFFSWLAYITGVFFCAKFLMQLKNHWENPQQTPIHRPLLYALAGGCMMALPGFCTMMVETIYGTPVGGANACAQGAAVAGPPTLDTLAENFVLNIKEPIFYLGGWICYFMGVFFIWRGLDKMARYGTDPRAYSTNAIVSNLGFGTILLWLGQAKNVIMRTIWDANFAPEVGLNGSHPQLAYANGSGSCGGGGWGMIDWCALGVTGNTAQFDNAYIAATTFMQIVGFIGFIRGWFICKHAVEGIGNATIGQGFTHIIGGAICMNLILFLKAFENTVNMTGQFLT